LILVEVWIYSLKKENMKKRGEILFLFFASKKKEEAEDD
jgi:hypothetical protein